MADFVKGLFGGQQPVKAAGSGDDGKWLYTLKHEAL